MKKRMIIMLSVLGILFGCILFYKLFISFMIKRSLQAQQNPIVTVSTMKATTSTWQPQITAAGSVRAIRGVDVTTSLAGMVTEIYFLPGQFILKNTPIVQLNADAEIGQLASLQAQAALAQLTYTRDTKQYHAHAISQQTLETDLENLKSLQGQVAEQSAIVAKKTVRAPFDGRLGINHINPGQYINPGDKIVSLQTLNPIYIDFYLPEQQLAALQVGQIVTVTTDAAPHQNFMGKITTIEPAIDSTTRNVEVEATIQNVDFKLAPGMFVKVFINAQKPVRWITLPQTAVSYNPYGALVYLVHEKSNQTKKPILTVTQKFVETGDTRGEQVAILRGIAVGDEVVTSGQLKLKNGSQITINNEITPNNSPSSAAPNTH